MATIADLTKGIKDFDTMSDTDKLKAIMGASYDDGKDEIEKLKNAVSKSNAEAAEWKRKHNSLLDDEGKKKQEDEDARNELLKQIEQLTKTNAEYVRNGKIAENATKLVACGWAEAEAKEAAAALADGDTSKYFELNTKFMTTHNEAIRQELLKNTPGTPAGSGNNGTDFNKAIREAMDRGDTARAVSLMRRQNNEKE